MKAEIADMRPSLLSEYLHAVESDLYQDSLMRNTLDIATDMHLVGGSSEMIKPLKSSTIFCSQYDSNGWYDQLGGDDSPLSEAILDRIKHDARKNEV